LNWMSQLYDNSQVRQRDLHRIQTLLLSTKIFRRSVLLYTSSYLFLLNVFSVDLVLNFRKGYVTYRIDCTVYSEHLTIGNCHRFAFF
jgi:hypothetical protein